LRRNATDIPEPSVTTEQQHGHLKELEGIKVRTMHRMVHECVVDGVLKQIVYLTNAQASILTSLRPPDEDLSKHDSPHQHKNPLQRLIEIFVLEERIERGLPPPRMVIRLIRSLEGTGHKFFYAQLHHCSPQYSKKGQLGDGVFMYIPTALPTLTRTKHRITRGQVQSQQLHRRAAATN
jgi:hypothetical protein